MPKRKVGEPLIIEWLDIVQDVRWQSQGEIKQPDSICKSIGFYLGEDKKFIYLASMMSSDERDQTSIPKGCVERVIKLTESKCSRKSKKRK